MIRKLETQQLETIQRLGYEGEGDLENVIEWLGYEFVGLSPHTNQDREIDLFYAEGWNDEVKGKTPLEAVFNLAKAINSKQSKKGEMI